MIFAIKSCWKDNVRGCHDAIRNSWGEGQDVRFFLGGNEPTHPDEFTLDVADDYQSLPYKVREMCRHLLKEGVEGAFFCDNDTFVNPLWLNPRGDYYGRFYYDSKIPWATSGPRFAFGGTGYWLSSAAMLAVSTSPVYRENEDEWVGSVIRSAPLLQIVEANNERFERQGAWHYTKNLYPRWPKYEPKSLWMEAMKAHHIDLNYQETLESLDRVTFPWRVTQIGKTSPAIIQAKISQLVDYGTLEDLVALAATIDIEKKPLTAITLLEWNALSIAYRILGNHGLSEKCREISESKLEY